MAHTVPVSTRKRNILQVFGIPIWIVTLDNVFIVWIPSRSIIGCRQRRERYEVAAPMFHAFRIPGHLACAVFHMWVCSVAGGAPARGYNHGNSMRSVVSVAANHNTLAFAELNPINVSDYFELLIYERWSVWIVFRVGNQKLHVRYSRMIHH